MVRRYKKVQCDCGHSFILNEDGTVPAHISKKTGAYCEMSIPILTVKHVALFQSSKRSSNEET
jgi:hypothetical protein